MRTGHMLIGLVAAAALAAAAAAQEAAAPPAVPPTARPSLDASLRDLFVQSMDLFTLLLVTGSVASLAVILQNLWEVRSSRIIPAGVIEKTKRLAALGRWEELRRYTTQGDDTFISRVVRGAMATTGEGRGAVREAAELAVSEECARLFRRIEPLNIIGNLGPLLGLAGTVWGMIIAFTSLGQGGGEANPGELALGISKALFHTLLGLMLAVPSLLAFGFFRTAVDRICNRAMMESSAIVELLPESAAERGAVPAVPTDHRHAMGRTTGAPHPPAHAPAAVVGAPERSPG